MQHTVLHQGPGAIILVQLEAGESVTAESDAMAAMSGNVEVGATLGGGFGKALARVFLSGETLFLQTLTAKKEPGQVFLSAKLPGDIAVLEVKPGAAIQIQNGSYLASLGGVNIETKMQKLGAGLFSGAGLFVTKATGNGHVAVAAFGAIEELQLGDGLEFVVDTGHIVAWSDGMQAKVEKASRKGWLASAASGEYLVCRFKGPGSVWFQTRNPSSFASWVAAQAPSKSS